MQELDDVLTPEWQAKYQVEPLKAAYSKVKKKFKTDLEVIFVIQQSLLCDVKWLDADLQQLEADDADVVRTLPISRTRRAEQYECGAMLTCPRGMADVAAIDTDELQNSLIRNQTIVLKKIVEDFDQVTLVVQLTVNKTSGNNKQKVRL